MMYTRISICFLAILALHNSALEYRTSNTSGDGKHFNALEFRLPQKNPAMGKNRSENQLRSLESPGKPSSSRSKRKSPCHRDSLKVEFADLGWDNWIIAPLSYDAFTCKGVCDYPLSHHFNATNHATVQSIVHSISPRKVPKACCIPTKYSSLTILHTDKNGATVLKEYKNMIVEACGCR